MKKYIVGRNKNFWKAIHQANSSPLWSCIVATSWPVNPKSRTSKIVVNVANDALFKVVATAAGLQYSEYQEWKCHRCNSIVDMVNKRCKCKTSPSPWEPV